MNHVPTTRGFFFSALIIVCFALMPAVQAVVPTPDGCYPNYTTAEGCNALNLLTTGAGNTGVGWYSLFSNTDASFNTGVGGGALALNNGDSNTAVGAAALLLNTSGTLNTAVGTDALIYNDSGNRNTATGAFALFSNTNGVYNTAVGMEALFDNTTAIYNTAIGASALYSNTIGSNNTATGSGALYFNISGDFNTAIGYGALSLNTTGSYNTGVGITPLYANTTGDDNIAIGFSALFGNTTGSGNIGIGKVAGQNIITASNVIAIGTDGADISDSCFIGQIYSNIQPQVGTDPDLVTINSSGRLGRANVSSRRYKHDIKPMEEASEAIYALKPVSFRYNKQYDATQTIAFGLIAEDVATVNPHLVGRNPAGQPESVRYEQINAMLLNEFLKEHRKVQELEGTVANLVTAMKDQAALIQKVSAQLEMHGPTAKVVVNKP